MQAGGSDLIVPHHEMSASHAKVAFAGGGGHKFARWYVHARMVRRGEKMSKPVGNLVFVSALRDEDADLMAIRLAILARHYRSGTTPGRGWTRSSTPITGGCGAT